MKTALVAVVIVAMAVASAGLMQPPTYEASALLLVDWQQDSQWENSGGSGEQIQPAVYREPPTLGITYAIDSRYVTEEAIQRLELQMDPAELSDNLTVEQVEATQFIRLTYEDTNPERARAIVNTVGEVSSELAERSGTFTATVWEKAAVPESPVSPHPLRNGLLTLVIGLMLCAGTALALPGVGARVAGTLGERPSRQGVGQAGVLGRRHRDHSIVERINEKKLLRAIGRRGKLTAVEASLETSLSVEEANRMLQALALQGQLEVTVEHGRLYYAFWEGGA
jgi:capsular polysaccharide biosynthesis protein